MLNLAEGLERSASLDPDKVALHFANTSITYGQLQQQVNRITGGLRSLGLRPGDKVAVSCPNLPFFPMVYYAILKLGAVVVPINVLLKPDEIAFHLEDSDAKAYFCFEGTDQLPMGEMGRAAFNKTVSCEHFILLSTSNTEVSGDEDLMTLEMLMEDQPADTDTAYTSAEDTAVILYTSGTTGKPKGAELTHGNMVMNAMSGQILEQLTSADTQLITLPLFHSFGQTVQMNASIQAGASMVLIPRFEPDAVLDAMQQHGVTVFAGVPTMFIGLLNHPGAEQYDLQGIVRALRLAISGGASLPVEVIKQFEERFDVPILEGYGLSETSPLATFNHLGRERIPGSIGQPIAGVNVKITDSDGRELSCGEPGEIAIKGHNVMKGYHRRPEATAEVMRAGWFHTGDIGKKDEHGNVYIVDRLKEMIIRGGFNVYPREIEEVLMQHEAIAMVAVIGVPHETHGEEIKAYVVPKNGYRDEDALRGWAKSRLADYKYPRLIEFCDGLPMTATGKILKRKLRVGI